MRPLLDREKLLELYPALAMRVPGSGQIDVGGSATALWHRWRETTVDLDIKADPEPPGLFVAIAELKERLHIYIKLAAPDHFPPQLPNWRERSPFIVCHNALDFHHYSPYSQVLAKLERVHPRDSADAAAFARAARSFPAEGDESVSGGKGAAAPRVSPRCPQGGFAAPCAKSCKLLPPSFNKYRFDSLTVNHDPGL